MSITYLEGAAIINLVDGFAKSEFVDQIDALVVEAILAESPSIILDMQGVTVIDSAGVAKILSIYKSLQTSRSALSLQNMSSEVHNVLSSLMFFSMIKKVEAS